MSDTPASATIIPPEVPPRRGSAFVAAVQFLTRLPLPVEMASPDILRRSPVYFPLVGALIGGSTALTAWLGLQIWPTWVAVVAALAVEAWLTGGLHEDAVADFCDAFGGGWTREKTLEILKDSHVGSYGVLGLLFSVGLRAMATVTVVEAHDSPWVWIVTLMTAAAIGRWTMVLAMATVAPVANRDGLARDVGRTVSRGDLALSTLWIVPLVLLYATWQPLHALLAAVGLALFTWPFLAWIERRLGGTTGDCLGCTGSLAQVLFLLLAAARLPGGAP